jgi:hypothetical protein
MRKSVVAGLFVFIMAVGVCARASSPPRPLSADDVTLLLIGGSNSQKIVSLIEQRGVDFKLTPALAKQFYQDGASDAVMDALQRASQNVKATPAETSPHVAPSASQPGPMPAPPTGTGVIAPAPAAHPASPAPAPSLSHAAAPARSQNHPPPPSDTPLPDPSPAQIQHIIQAVAANETLFKEARANYLYHQINRVETLDASGNVDGSWEQDWDISFNGNGQRVESVTYAPPGDLKDLIITQQDINAFRNIHVFVFTTDELPEYNIRYLGHVHKDYLTCYVFSVRPNDIKKNHQYFDGTVWVDDHNLQIVYAEGRNVPQLKQRFPRFATWRQQIDGKYWFPVFTKADDTLYFDNGGPPIHVIEIVKYTDYKQFRSRTKIISYGPVTQSSTPKH